MGGTLRTAALALAVLVLTATPASAAKVSIRTTCEGYPKGCIYITYVTYKAAPGEQNDLKVRWRNGAVTFTDRVPITAPSKCGRISPTSVRCSGTDIEVALGDGDDAAAATGYGDDRLSTTTVRLDGGPGNDWLVGDRINGGDGDDLLVGTAGADEITGGAGVDELHGGDGDDFLNGDGGPKGTETGTDSIDGGAGSDTVSYDTRSTPVEVDLPAQVGGGPGEMDRLQSIENATGGGGADKLVGDDSANRLQGGGCADTTRGGPGDLILGGAGDDGIDGGCNPNRLYGEAGDDRILGAGGADLIDGGPGNDVLGAVLGANRFVGGDGDDQLFPNGEPGEDVSCGTGHDRAFDPGFALLRPDCENVTVVYMRALVYPQRPTSSDLEFTVRCPAAGRSCKAKMRLKVLGRRRAFASGQFSSKDGVLHPHFNIPRYVRDKHRSPLPIRAIVDGIQREGGRDDFVAEWVFDLSATPVGAAAPSA